MGAAEGESTDQAEVVEALPDTSTPNSKRKHPGQTDKKEGGHNKDKHNKKGNGNQDNDKTGTGNKQGNTQQDKAKAKTPAKSRRNTRDKGVDETTAAWQLPTPEMLQATDEELAKDGDELFHTDYNLMFFKQ